MSDLTGMTIFPYGQRDEAIAMLEKVLEKLKSSEWYALHHPDNSSCYLNTTSIATIDGRESVSWELHLEGGVKLKGPMETE